MNLRDRYYIRFEKVLKPYQKVLDEYVDYQFELRKKHLKESPEDYYATTGILTDESRDAWFLEKHNIVISHNANGVIKLGFASKEDVTLFVLKNS
jgi:hypothetical protein